MRLVTSNEGAARRANTGQSRDRRRKYFVLALKITDPQRFNREHLSSVLASTPAHRGQMRSEGETAGTEGHKGRPARQACTSFDVVVRGAVCYLAVVHGAACRTVPTAEYARPAASTVDAKEFRPVEIGTTTRPAAPAHLSSEIRFEFRNVSDGALLLHAGKLSRSDREARLTATFHCDDLVSRFTRREDVECMVPWEAADVSERWQPCRIQIDEPCHAGTITLAVDADSKADIVLTEPSYRGHVASDRPDVFFVLVDTVRSDRLRPFSEILPLGSALDRFADDSLVFARVRSTSSWTRPATVTLLTGLRSETHAVHDRRDAFPASIPSLPAILRKQGYFTFALSANANILPVWGFANGYDEFHDVGANNWATAKTDARELFDRLIDELESDSPAPGFYYVHMMDPHAPYVPSESDLAAVEAWPGIEETFPHRTWEFGRKQEVAQYKKYLGEIHDVDAEIGRFVSYLRSARRYRDSLIVVVSDHGEEFRDHGLLYHGTGLFEEVLKVPMMIKLPASADLAGRVDTSISIEHLMPTILTALDIPVPDRMDGRSLIERLPRDTEPGRGGASPAPTRFRLASWLSQPPEPQFATLKLDRSRISAVVAEPWKLIKYHHVESELLYNLALDPHETRNLADENLEKLAEMRELLAGEMARNQTGWHFLFCGANNAASLAVRLRGAPSEPMGHDLEGDDHLGTAAVDGSRELRLSLPLISFEVEQLGAMVKRTVPDHDKVTVPSPDLVAISVVPIDDTPLRYTLGASRELRTGMELRLSDVAADATIDGFEWLECPLADTDLTGRAVVEEQTPYLRIWRVARRSAVDSKDVSPEILERLRRLGYMW